MASSVSFDTPITSNDQSFDRVLKAGLPVLALFFSGSIPSELEGELKSTAKQDAGQLLVVRIKNDENPQLQGRYKILGLTLIGFRNGEEAIRFEYPTAQVAKESAGYLLGRGPAPRVEPRPQPQYTTPPRPSASSAPPDGSGKPVAITDQSFQSAVMQSPVPVVVDFWAPWCGPCRMVAPTLEKLAAQYGDRLRIAKMNVDENPVTAQMHQVSGIPTLLFVKNGRIVDRVVGALPEPQLRRAVEKFVNS